MSSSLKFLAVDQRIFGSSALCTQVCPSRRQKKFIRGEIAHAVNLKFAPDIRFLPDETFDEAQRIDSLLASEKVRRDLGK